MRAALAALCVAGAVVLAVLAHDLLAWRSADTKPPATWVPGDPVGSVFSLRDDLALRRAVRAYVVAKATKRGFDAGETQTRVRSAAEVRLSDVAAGHSGRDASQAGDLLGVLVLAGGRVTGGLTPDDRAQDAFDAAIRRDTSNTAAKENLELLLRKTRATSTRHGAGNGSGSRGQGRRGAGAGTPGRGY